LNTTLTPHSMIHGDACFAYFNKIWGIPPKLLNSLLAPGFAGRRMPSWLSEVLKLMGFTTPFVYAAAVYGLFHYLDKKASGAAKKAISGWLQPKEYDKAAVAAAMVEIFDRHQLVDIDLRSVLRVPLEHRFDVCDNIACAMAGGLDLI
jgi:hypothetical protein